MTASGKPTVVQALAAVMAGVGATKVCSRCGEEKPLQEMRANGSGRFGWCKSCHNAAAIAWQKANPEKVKAARRARYVRERSAVLAERRRERDANPEGVRDRDRWAALKHSYRVSREQYEAMLAAQGGGCAICDAKPNGRRLSVDHDHTCCPKPPTCGRCNRGLLCNPCNLALHNLEARGDWLERATAYLGESKEAAA